MRIRWEELEPGTYETVVANLLGQMNPDVERIDGSGGDEGRDVIFDSGSHREIFQLTSFTGRMSQSRRTKIKKDLAKAAAHNPTAWYLVVPIDPTPGEKRWFKEVTKICEFPCRWRGLNWLESQIASHPELVRYAQGDANSEVVALLAQLREEQAAVESADDAAARVRDVVRRLNETDPHYKFVISTDGVRASVTAQPRYADAFRDAPIGGTLTVSGEGERSVEAVEALQQMYDFGLSEELEFTEAHGLSVAMDLPGGMGHDGPVSSLILRPTSTEEEIHAELRLVDGGATVSTLPILLWRMSTGRRGGNLRGHDRLGVLSIAFRFDRVSKSVEFNSTTSLPGGAIPAEVVPALAFIRSAVEGTELQLVVDDIVLVRLLLTEPWNPITEGVAFMEQLARIQQAVGRYFAIPEEIPPDTLFWVRILDEILRGRVAEVPWTEQELEITVIPDGRSVIAELLSPGPSQFEMVNDQLILDIGGNQIAVGPVVVHIPAAVITNRADVQTALREAPVDEEVPLVLVLEVADPADEHKISMWLLQETV